MAVPKYLRADMERAFIQAYYRFVCGCESVSVDVDLGHNSWTALAVGSHRVWVMDFSTQYEFPAEMKPSTAARKMLDRAGAATRAGRLVDFLGEMESPPEVTYEVWCFIPPSQKVLGAVEYTRANGGKVTLVLPDEVDERLRQAALAVPESSELENAFVQAALMFRKAFGLR